MLQLAVLVLQLPQLLGFSAVNANDVALLQQIVEMQARTFTFEQITAARKFKASANQIERIRKGQL